MKLSTKKPSSMKISRKVASMESMKISGIANPISRVCVLCQLH
jgi:hypothetical protein